MKNLIIGFVFSTIISLAAYKKNSLSESGAIAATIMGGLMYFFWGLCCHNFTYRIFCVC